MGKSAELQFNIDLGWEMGDVMRRYFDGERLAVDTKADKTPVTEADLFISDQVVAAFKARGRGVVSEEKGRSAAYGIRNAEYLDPIDGTKDFTAGQHRSPRRSIAAFSLGSVVGGKMVRGVIAAPLLATPRMYWAEAGQGAFRMMSRGGSEQRLRVAKAAKSGIVLVTDSAKTPKYIDRVREQGFTPVKAGGSVMKACCLADLGLFHQAYPELEGDLCEKMPVVGFMSDSAWAHDYAAAAVVVREAGGLACDKRGGALKLSKGLNGCVFSINKTIQSQLVGAMRA